jgi:hypothetical protein
MCTSGMHVRRTPIPFVRIANGFVNLEFPWTGSDVTA